jgi:hypothetical protein
VDTGLDLENERINLGRKCIINKGDYKGWEFIGDVEGWGKLQLMNYDLPGIV